MSALADALADYLTMRRALGFELAADGRYLPDLVAFIEEHGSDILTVELALTWARRPAGARPAWWAKRLGLVRGFARHLHALDARHEVPPPDLLPVPRGRPTPYLYSEADLDRLLGAARELPLPLKAATHATLIGLLAVTGMRVGEAIGLDRDDLDRAAGVLTIRGAKFGKSREVALHPSTLAALDAYERTRRRHHPHPRTSAFLVSTTGTRLLYSNVQLVFGRLLRAAGVAAPPGHPGPRLHDLRHTFAVRTLLEWYRAGLDVEARMHRLSTYLGHSDPAHAYWYLHAAPELLALAAERQERAMDGVAR